MARSIKGQVGALVPGTLLGIAALMFGEPLLALTGVDVANRTNLVTVAVIFFMLAGFLLAAHSLHESYLRQFEAKLGQVSGALRPLGSDEALRYIARRAVEAQLVRNTMIMFADHTYNLGSESLKEWRKARHKAIMNDVYVREVVSPGYRNRALALARKFPIAGTKGKYEAFVVDCQLGSFLNFTVLEYKNEPSEVVFGWVVTDPGRGFDLPCFQTFNPKVVQLFVAWFDDLVIERHSSVQP